MAYTFFNISILTIWVVFLVVIYKKKIRINSMLIGVASVAYSFVYEVFFGIIFKLYYYISPDISSIYLWISCIFLYPVLNMIYTAFLPVQLRTGLVYTLVWIILMLLLEYASIRTKTVVFTGWRMFPWSYLTYLFTYFWINMFNKYLLEQQKA